MSASTSSHEGFAPYLEHRTWYRVTGDLRSGKVPLVVAHGGPGCTHDYVDAFKDIASRGRAVVHYDQLGNGRSTHLREAPEDFWTVPLFLGELDNLLAHLGIAHRYDLLGHSWGGMLAAEHAVLQPEGLNALVIASSPASFPLWVAEALRLRQALPGPVREALDLHERNGDFTHPDYLAATEVFYRRHVCRMSVWPDEVKRTFAELDADPTVYRTMNGPTEFHVIGTLRAWHIEDRLHAVRAPTLVMSGRFDEATPACVAPYVDNIAGARSVVMQSSSHMSHVEERESTMAIVEDFLSRHDQPGS